MGALKAALGGVVVTALLASVLTARWVHGERATHRRVMDSVIAIFDADTAQSNAAARDSGRRVDSLREVKAAVDQRLAAQIGRLAGERRVSDSLERSLADATTAADSLKRYPPLVAGLTRERDTLAAAVDSLVEAGGVANHLIAGLYGVIATDSGGIRRRDIELARRDSIDRAQPPIREPFALRLWGVKLPSPRLVLGAGLTSSRKIELFVGVAFAIP